VRRFAADRVSRWTYFPPEDLRATSYLAVAGTLPSADTVMASTLDSPASRVNSPSLNAVLVVPMVMGRAIVVCSRVGYRAAATPISNASIASLGLRCMVCVPVGRIGMAEGAGAGLGSGGKAGSWR